MKLVRNLAANAAYQLWTILLTLLVLPAYLGLLGPESYALIGVSQTVMAWAMLLDAGLSPVLMRDMARLGSGEADEAEVHSFVRSLDWICLAIVLIFCTLAVLTRDWWAVGWFRTDPRHTAMIGQSVALIIAFSVLRWGGSLFRSGLMGLEKQVTASAIGTVANTLRLLGGFGLLILLPDPRALFAMWAAVSLAELLVYRILLGGSFRSRVGLLHFSMKPLARRLAFAGSIALLALIQVLITQADKVILSRVLSLRDFGYFTLAIILANGLLMLTLPIVQAFQPQMVVASGGPTQARMGQLVNGFTAAMVLAVVVPALVVAMFPERLLFAWTGDSEAASTVSPYLGYYVLGCALFGPAGIAYSVQLAHGRLRIHVIVNLVFAALLIPGIWWVTGNYGARGAAILWFAMNLGVLMFYCAPVLHLFLPGHVRSWLRALLLPAAAAAAVVGAARLTLGDVPASRLPDLLLIGTIGALALIAAAAASPAARGWLSVASHRLRLS